MIELQEIVDAAESQNPNLIVISGDKEYEFLNPLFLSKENRKKLAEVFEEFYDSESDTDIVDLGKNLAELTAKTKAANAVVLNSFKETSAYWSQFIDSYYTETRAGEASPSDD